MKKSKEQILFIVWAQSVIATLGSLYFSEIMGFIPCELCWFQRILMYPLVIIYGTALVKKDWNIALPGLFMSGIGIGVSSYHYLVQKLPKLSEAGGSCGIIPCNTEYINYFGFVTIPFLAFVAFVVIFSLHISILIQQRRKDQ
ncbi:disulfide oxidoreductase [Aquibacillus koreensis]|uniref:Probable disulfide formation protein n=1 Tax=Aquibacillus koreensis TaxID=279446 RepID=A0A9X3WMQ3_9BACI|nr:disulfide oxidoreductase [Aquibacillus koreensis]MCT2535579.1 disulfide oxidoreductase [Aquibacillus koreensis]MDC3420136.1 disulfide oxidoreductase [Aquibacillus koreensis]